ncbi:hypothetical protein PS870_03912 [Pseudomonas fluorescens]|uniref:Uncharacterized protein n=1 Tax=Pseudomonas fluorescens TaxID=294 RepID=A0A5E7ME55_PSEFL|nr:hypothetical protein [Pseudomonas fluorescens]VVP22837.1 hypothetical protein PS870_03912 [Pseudomonas fluorescens]VVQ32431.1 hypothetical protein PS947_02927 [Pseudomonas fluorescens]
MNDKAAKKLAEGELARKGRALQSIKEILGLTDETYQSWLNSMTENERATHDVEVERYMVTCTIMSAEYVQWSSQLLLAAPEGVESENTYQSSLLAPMGAVLLNALEKNPGKAVPQHLRGAANQIKKLVDAKQRFLTELHKNLREEEKATYGDLLKICDPLLCAMPDLALYETFYRLNLAWDFRAKLLVRPQDGVPEHQIDEAVARAYRRTTELSSIAVQRVLESSATPEKDSLAARLMLATMVNRSHWELLEFERMEQIATQSLSKLVRGLQRIGNRLAPAYLEKEAFKDWLIKQFSQQDFLGEAGWRPLKPQHLERFYTQAGWVLEWEKFDFVEHEEKREVLLNMCALHLAWSYCSGEKHDLRVPDIKDFDLVNGREIESGEQVPLTRIMCQQRQLNTMLRSHQHYELNPQKLETYTKCNRDGRRQNMKFIRTNLHTLSLAQWKSLTRGVWEILAPLLLKRGEL